ncbi:MAG: trehalose-phosphatase, partial [Actinomycetota bacterium]|nr:trehalose-phosphatase [Actinomycetota bacterium]
PSACVPAPGAMVALRALARLPGTHVAIVSGRDLATLAGLTGVQDHEPIVLVGSHGAESSAQGVVDGRLDDAQRGLLDELTTIVAELIEDHPGARLERKRSAVAVHTRGLPQESADAALLAAEALSQGRDDVRVLRGKSVLELSVSHADKGSALRALADAVGAETVFYSGDDVTDEDAFAVLDPRGGDVTVKVGQGDTAAAHRVESVAELVETIAQLLELRRALAPGSAADRG